MTKPASNQIPFSRDRPCDPAGKRDSPYNNSVITMTTGRSRVTANRSMLKLVITAGIPTTASELNRLEPITLPIARSGSPFFILAIDAASSGQTGTQCDNCQAYD